ncbi:ATP-dependent DNA ligase [Amycolatopsis antarctica]|uniref:ATP-dependent DNA ligase n=1 Tax=Amycolatopsis antarctica TaxID=1854586 RepID=A0A263D0D9_9PSEU|nr:ATP-dependent DNA ligase [Amycolatopsis antarctica]OZM71892.1 ATP-dependent DNA ligase [Amycolatopsis antarctica]
MQLPVMPPVAPMLARPAREIPDGCSYEPKWDGFRAVVFRDGEDVEIGSRGRRSLTRYFPDLVAAFRHDLPSRCVLDGEIVVEGASGGLDFFALQQRVHPAASRVATLAERSPARFVAFDMLALGETDHTPDPFHRRRCVLERALLGARAPIHLTPLTTDPAVAARWFTAFEGAGLDGLIAKDPDLPYLPNRRAMAKVKHVRTADCVLAGYRVHKSGPGLIGSLLLGLHDDAGAWAETTGWTDQRGGLVPVGVAAAFPMARRRELFDELRPLVTGIEDHPWSWVAEVVAGRAGSGRGGTRWDAARDLSFVPLRPDRVLEVRYDYMEGFRFRHPAQFARWRPDREPASCGYAQLDRPRPADLADVLAGRIR